MSRSKKSNNKTKFILFLIILCIGLIGMALDESETNLNNQQVIIENNTQESIQPNENIVSDGKEFENVQTEHTKNFILDNIPEYSENPYVVINNNIPFFNDSDLTTKSYEQYSELDGLGRCGVVIANIGKDLMPTGEREYIGSVKPTGWQVSKYDWVDGKYLYNRCHLIGYQLSGENANDKNLITGTRYMNVQGMLPFENMVADYVKETGNHVLYRVTPIFEGNNLVASGVLMEAKSVEDNGDGVEFNVYCYNVQPGVEIDYATGENSAIEVDSADEKTETYILNTSSKKFHKTSCSGANSISEKNRSEYNGTRNMLILQGYEPCGTCNP